MKRIANIILISLLSLSIVGCGNDKSASKVNVDSSKSISQSEKQVAKPEQSQDDLNKEIKSKAEKADFVKINGGEWKSKEVFVEGEITLESSSKILPEFTVTTKEGNGFGMYSVVILDTSKVDNYKKGSQVKVYGKVLDKNDLGMPQISGNVIELK